MNEVTEQQKPSLFGIITSPSEQFKRIQENPVIWGAMGIIIVLFMINVWITFQNIDLVQDVSEVLETEIDEALIEFVEFTKNVMIFIGGIIGPIIGVLITTVIYLIIAKIADSEVTFRQLFSLNTHLMIITVLGALLNGVFHLIFGGEEILNYTSLGLFIRGDSPLAVIANSLDVFGIWHIILTATGLQIVARFSKGLAWGVPIIIFIIGILFSIADANIQM